MTRNSPRTSWPVVPLGSVARVVGGSTPDSGNVSYWGGDIVWVTPADLGQLKTTHVRDSGRRITRLGFRSASIEMLPIDSVILSSRAPIGYLAINDVPLCTNQGCKSFVPGTSLDARYLFYFLRRAVPTLRELGSGATFAEVSKSKLESYPIALPPLADQQRIVAKLDEQMAALDRAEKALTEQQAAAFTLATTALHQIFASPESEQWPQSALSELCEFIRGVTFEQSEALPTPSEGHLPILRAGNIADTLALDSDLVWVPSHRVSPDQLLKSGDIVMCMSSGSAKVVGKSARVLSDWAGSAGAFCGILRPREVVDANWLAFWLRSAQFTAWRDSQARGANIQNLRFSQMSNIALRVPSLREQRRIAAKLESASNGIAALQSHLSSQHAVLVTLRATLLDVAFSGEI